MSIKLVSNTSCLMTINYIFQWQDLSKTREFNSTSVHHAPITCLHVKSPCSDKESIFSLLSQLWKVHSKRPNKSSGIMCYSHNFGDITQNSLFLFHLQLVWDRYIDEWEDGWWGHDAQKPKRLFKGRANALITQAQAAKGLWKLRVHRELKTGMNWRLQETGNW